jgi:hypothetical protein
MASLGAGSATLVETHLEKVNLRAKALKKIQGWPQYGDFLSPERETMISQLISDLSDTESLEDYYNVLLKATQALGNQLQQVYDRKQTSKFFALHLGKSDAFPCPDPQLHYFMKITYENVIGVYAERVTEALRLPKKKVFPPALLNVYLHEMKMLEQEVAELPANTMLLQYLDQWGRNMWPQALRASDIIPRSWTHCVAKMRQIMALEWKEVPDVILTNEDGTSVQVVDDSKSLSSFIAHRSFFLALYLYSAIHPQFFASNFEHLISKTKESLLGQFLVEWVDTRTKRLKASESHSNSHTSNP